MRLDRPGNRFSAILLAGVVAFLGAQVAPGWGADYGRLSGTVADTQGNPLLGATVLLTGPLLDPNGSAAATVERINTDALGKFAIEHLLPGWYSLRVTAPTRLPVLRSGIRVVAGRTSTERFVLADIFSPVRFRVPESSVTSWGDDWQWVLRTSSATRPILRFQEQNETAQADPKVPLAPSSRMLGMVPGSARRGPLAEDPGLGSVLAYLRPLSKDSDLLVAGSMAASGVEAGSVATSFRRDLLKGDPQELTLVFHRLSFSDGSPVAVGFSPFPLASAQMLVVGYSQTRPITSRLSLTAGTEVHYLSATRSAMNAQPRLRLEYRLDAETRLAVQYGTGVPSASDTLLDRVGMLNASPRVTLQGYRPRLEQLDHAEFSVNRRLKKSTRLEAAAYRDALHNAAVWSSGHPESLAWLGGNFLPNPAADGVTLNAGSYRSVGFRGAVLQDFGGHVHALVGYAMGDALTPQGDAQRAQERDLQGFVRPVRSSALAAKVSAQLPVTHTNVSTSYEWTQRDRLTLVDPYGQANLDVQPFWGVLIRQPLPPIGFIPVRIEALADFRNLLDQGSVQWGRPGEHALLLTPLYRSFRGGFSVQF